ncbi:MAG: hypothetical protein ACYC0C_12550 [Devosia sp.]
MVRLTGRFSTVLFSIDVLSAASAGARDNDGELPNWIRSELGSRTRWE